MNLKSSPSQRQIRFGEVIRSIISDFLIRGDFFNTEIDISTITVSFVKMSKDLRVASVYFMPLGGKNKDQILQLLNDNKYAFQKSISRAKLRSKFTPKINFYIDNSFEEAEKIENLLLDQKVLRDLDNG
jgi:ribosome-binding factor A